MPTIPEETLPRRAQNPQQWARAWEDHTLDLEKILNFILAQEPVLAARPELLHLEHHYLTPVVTRWRHGDGSLVDLRYVTQDARGRPCAARYALILVRVSAEAQRAEGYSLDSQVIAGIRHCIERGWAFRIANDAALSGGMPALDRPMQESLWRAKADRTWWAFEAVLTGFENRLDPDQRRRIARYRDRQVARIERGLCGDDTHLLEGTEEELPGSEDMTEAPRRHRQLRRAEIRPGLTRIWQWLQQGTLHAVVVSDLSRLTRILALSVQLHAQMEEKGIALIGSIENLGAMSDRNVGKVVGALYAFSAETKLKEVTTGHIRGVLAKLLRGEPPYKLPRWIVARETVPQGYEGPQRVVSGGRKRKILQFNLLERQKALDTLEIFRQVGTFHGTAMEIMRRYGGTCYRQSVKKILTQTALYGYQEIYGVEWPTLTGFELLSREDWESLQQQVRVASSQNPGARRSRPRTLRESEDLLTGLVRCSCGLHLLQYAWHSQGFRVLHCPAIRAGLHRDRSHVWMRATLLGQWIQELMSRYVDDVEARLGYNLGLDSLEAHLQAAREEVLAAARARDAFEKEQRSALVEILARLEGYSEENINTQVRVLLGANSVYQSLKDRLEAAESQVLALEANLRQLQAVLAEDGVRKRLKAWSDLTSREQNELLHQILAGIWIREEAGEEKVLIQFMGKEHPEPPIPVFRKVYRMRRGRPIYQRQLLPVTEWRKQAISLQGDLDRVRATATETFLAVGLPTE